MASDPSDVGQHGVFNSYLILLSTFVFLMVSFFSCAKICVVDSSTFNIWGVPWDLLQVDSVYLFGVFCSVWRW
jgi:hypothetical protein